MSIAPRKAEGDFGMLRGGGAWVWGMLRGGVSAGVAMALVGGDAGAGSPVLCGASSDDAVVPGPFWGGSALGGMLFAFEF